MTEQLPRLTRGCACLFRDCGAWPSSALSFHICKLNRAASAAPGPLGLTGSVSSALLTVPPLLTALPCCLELAQVKM
jgi:hypothetical protein